MRLMLHDRGPYGETKVKCFQYLSCNVNKHFRPYRLAAALKRKSHLAGHVETEVFFGP